MKIIGYAEILNFPITIEFEKGENYHFAMIRVGDHGYLAGNGSDGIHLKPTTEFASHFAIEAVGNHLTFLLDHALNQSGN